MATKASLPPPGTSDITPAEAPTWNSIENTARKVFGLYGYGELRTPIFEYTEVFQRGLGNETEVVKKEMYTFEDRGGRSLTLRPEGTAGVMRSLSGTEAANGVEQRVFYIGPMFRGERPAAGRRRQFHQIGVENAGTCSPGLDAECISMLCHFLKEIQVTGFNLLINTRGVRDDRPPAENALREYFRPYLDNMCDDCKERFERNIWRILDCKCEECRKIIDKAPNAADFFTQNTKDYFKRVCDDLTAMDIPFTVDPRLVRGLDYYVHTVFELTHPGLGGQTAIAGGGRYELDVPGFSKILPGVGFAAGMERLLMVREALNVPVVPTAKPVLFLASAGAKALSFNVKLASALRHAGFSCALETEEKSIKSQMRAANRLEAAWSVVVGDTELESGKALFKRMSDGAQVEAALTAEAAAALFRQ